MSETKIKSTMGQALDLDGKDKPYQHTSDKKIILILRERIKELENQIAGG